MIIMGLLDAISSILLWIASFIPSDIPQFLTDSVVFLRSCINQGVGVLLFYFDTNIIGQAITFIIDFLTFYYVVKLIKFIIKTIPLLNINTDGQE